MGCVGGNVEGKLFVDLFFDLDDLDVEFGGVVFGGGVVIFMCLFGFVC